MRPTADGEAIPVGDDADPDGCDKSLAPAVAQVPDAVPVVPPPSNSAVEPDVPPVDIPEPKDVPVVAVPMPLDAPADEALRPKEACGSEPPMPAHAVRELVGGIMGDVPDVVGLTPGVASSVAPKGIPVGATAEPGPMPSGDVMPSGDGPGEMLVPPTCAQAAPQPMRTAAMAAVNKRVIASFS